MKNSFSIGLILYLFVTLANASDFKHIQLTDFRTNTLMNLSEIDKSKPTYIKMWATWCKPCMKQMPHFQSIYEKYGDKINIFAINININEDNKYIEDVIAKFGLTMPVLLDNEGQLGVELGLVGTPYSVLINTDNSIVYTTHESDNILDTFLDKLAEGQKLESTKANILTVKAKESLIEPWKKGDHILFFSATWCDWYLKDSRPDMASNCKNIQSNINSLSQQSGNIAWHGFVNNLWTDKKALEDFIKLYNIELPFEIDEGGVLFNYFNIRTIPTVIKIKDGKIIKKFTGDKINKINIE